MDDDMRAMRESLLERLQELGKEDAENWEILSEAKVTLGQARYMIRDYEAKGGAPGRMAQFLDTIVGAIRNLEESRKSVAELVEEAVLAERKACAEIAYNQAGSMRTANLVRDTIMERPLPTADISSDGPKP